MTLSERERLKQFVTLHVRNCLFLICTFCGNSNCHLSSATTDVLASFFSGGDSIDDPDITGAKWAKECLRISSPTVQHAALLALNRLAETHPPSKYFDLWNPIFPELLNAEQMKRYCEVDRSLSASLVALFASSATTVLQILLEAAKRGESERLSLDSLRAIEWASAGLRSVPDELIFNALQFFVVMLGTIHNRPDADSAITSITRRREYNGERFGCPCEMLAVRMCSFTFESMLKLINPLTHTPRTVSLAVACISTFAELGFGAEDVMEDRIALQLYQKPEERASFFFSLASSPGGSGSGRIASAANATEAMYSSSSSPFHFPSSYSSSDQKLHFDSGTCFIRLLISLFFTKFPSLTSLSSLSSTSPNAYLRLYPTPPLVYAARALTHFAKQDRRIAHSLSSIRISFPSWPSTHILLSSVVPQLLETMEGINLANVLSFVAVVCEISRAFRKQLVEMDIFGIVLKMTRMGGEAYAKKRKEEGEEEGSNKEVDDNNKEGDMRETSIDSDRKHVFSPSPLSPSNFAQNNATSENNPFIAQIASPTPPELIPADIKSSLNRKHITPLDSEEAENEENEEDNDNDNDEGSSNEREERDDIEIENEGERERSLEEEEVENISRQSRR
ncbi:uncharacterized protein MONOS_12796 [Monocercomonoides exilis]|uniref:uncharacterized protein n=1 Tax=Monocercomonoides exilis TaxID=2049356 RepID=UPI00355A6C2E|nr:hypothetical protein MONOS_12796 [Monocercomonoides exilis]|eukprot:MONOS_12796.1-p1 / transcript=MONOS_12796.1 / gene=MONOS_12796 / organism=Monocercomonoides_exilis_PA203 / gene_product=unspecified product / transcript_product=unspecified product / location=Mono_scaffold00734:6298-8240(+) / protein_length=623 / sequence_SO=supercontig / SO=protein_coding / is_pseudo=false